MRFRRSSPETHQCAFGGPTSMMPLTVMTAANRNYICRYQDLRDRRAFLTLLQDKRFLRFREPRCLHRSQLLSQPGNVSRKPQLQTVQLSGSRAHLFRRHAKLDRLRILGNSSLVQQARPPKIKYRPINIHKYQLIRKQSRAGNLSSRPIDLAPRANSMMGISRPA